MEKTIITAAMTGAITPAGYDIPERPEDIAAQVYECWKLGASVAHLHMRDDQGAGVMDPVRFYRTIKAIRAYEDCDVIINCTSSGDNRVAHDSPYGNAVRVLHHEIVPGIEMGTFDAGTFNWGIPGGVFCNSQTFLTHSGELFQKKNIRPECEIFDMGMLRAVGTYWKKGVLQEPIQLQFCLGVMGGMEASPEALQILVNEMRRMQAMGALPKRVNWSAFGIGKGHLPVMFAALSLGGSLRVGMEDNVVYAYDENGGKIMATNMMLVERAAQAVRAFGNSPATPAQAREVLGIPPLDRKRTEEELRAVSEAYIEAKKAELSTLSNANMGQTKGAALK